METSGTWYSMQSHGESCCLIRGGLNVREGRRDNPVLGPGGRLHKVILSPSPCLGIALRRESHLSEKKIGTVVRSSERQPLYHVQGRSGDTKARQIFNWKRMGRQLSGIYIAMPPARRVSRYYSTAACYSGIDAVTAAAAVPSISSTRSGGAGANRTALRLETCARYLRLD